MGANLHWVSIDPANIIRCIEEWQKLEGVIQLIDIWEQEQIFSKRFSDLLKQYIKPKVIESW